MRLERIDDETGFSVFHYQKMAPGRLFCDVVAVKASFDLTPNGISPVPRPGKFCMADLYRDPGDPTGSSLLEASDLMLGKPGGEIIVRGTARRSRPYRRWQVAVEVGPLGSPLINYACIATGPRRWEHGLMKGWRLSEPDFAQEVPIRYELAYGCRKHDATKVADQWDRYDINPSGSGYNMVHHSLFDTPPGTQWGTDTPFEILRGKELVGLGPVPRFWASRQRYGGIYDEAWERQHEENATPDYPKDIDLRYFQSAHPLLQAKAPFKGNEALRLFGLLPTTDALHTHFTSIGVFASFQNQQERKALPLDTVHIDLDAKTVDIVWRLTVPESLNIDSIRLTAGKV